MRKIDNPECKVIALIVDADAERCIYVASLDIRVEVSHFSRWCRRVFKIQFQSPHSPLNKSSMHRKVFLNWMAFVMSCFIVLTMKSYSKVWAKRSANKGALLVLIGTPTTCRKTELPKRTIIILFTCQICRLSWLLNINYFPRTVNGHWMKARWKY